MQSAAAAADVTTETLQRYGETNDDASFISAVCLDHPSRSVVFLNSEPAKRAEKWKKKWKTKHNINGDPHGDGNGNWNGFRGKNRTNSQGFTEERGVILRTRQHTDWRLAETHELGRNRPFAASCRLREVREQRLATSRRTQLLALAASCPASATGGPLPPQT